MEQSLRNRHRSGRRDSLYPDEKEEMCMNLKLVKLSREYREQLCDMMEEWLAAEQDFSPYAIRKNDYRDFDRYLSELEIMEEKDGLVPDSTFFCLDQDTGRFVGTVNIRHYLGPNNCHGGGHIGDGIRPSERRKGYATAMIGMALEECRKLGINKVLMTCDKTNIGSAKSILKNGGVLESEFEEDGVIEQRYWITLHEEVIETERLTMRREMPADAKEMFVWSGDARVYRYLLSNPVKKPEDMVSWLEGADPNAKDRYLMILHSREDGHAVGTVGFFYDKDSDTWSFAYNIRYDDWGKGYAAEATAAMMDYVTRVYGAHRFEAECACENIGSSRVIEKMGLKFDHYSSYSKNDGSETFRSKVYRLER